jgi:hypothetical protein
MIFVHQQNLVSGVGTCLISRLGAQVAFATFCVCSVRLPMYGGLNRAASAGRFLVCGIPTPIQSATRRRKQVSDGQHLKLGTAMNAQVCGSVTSRLLTTDTPIIILSSLVAEFGLVEAVFLQQLHYALQYSKGGIVHAGCKWIYNTLEQWCERLPCWSKATLERAIAKLRRLGIIQIEKLHPYKSIRTNYYRINYHNLRHIPELAEFGDTPKPQHPRKMRASTPQSADVDHRNPPSSIPAPCGDGYTKSTQDDNQEKKKAAHESKTTNTPTHPEPSHEQLATLPERQRELWQQLRRLKVDIAHDDVRLGQWIRLNQVKNVLQQLNHLISQQPTHGWMGYP